MDFVPWAFFADNIVRCIEPFRKGLAERNNRLIKLNYDKQKFTQKQRRPQSSDQQMQNLVTSYHQAEMGQIGVGEGVPT
ncbi:hypothetical protein ACHQM5_025185 [Ranunculus cassubicifolius]